MIAFTRTCNGFSPVSRCMIYSSKRGNINGLTSNSSCTSNPCRILTWSAVDDSIYQDLKWILSSQQMYDLEGVFHNSHSHKLFSVISSVHHERINQPLNDWALGLAKALCCVTTTAMR